MLAIRPEDWLPLAMIVISLSASVVYGAFGRLGSMAYWASAGVLTYSVTFMIRRWG